MIVAPLWVFLILFAISGLVWLYRAVAVRPKERAQHEQQKSQLYGQSSQNGATGESRPKWD